METTRESGSSNAMAPETARVTHLRRDARYHRERRDLYRAKVYGPRATSLTRLRELERASEQASELLRAAQAQEEDMATRHGPQSA